MLTVGDVVVVGCGDDFDDFECGVAGCCLCLFILGLVPCPGFRSPEGCGCGCVCGEGEVEMFFKPSGRK